MRFASVPCLFAALLAGFCSLSAFAGEDAKQSSEALEALAAPADIVDPSYLRQLAQVHLGFGAAGRAEPLLRKALELIRDPAQKASVQALLAEVLKRKRDYSGAAEAYQSVIGATKEPAERMRLSNALADVYLQAKDFDKAEKALTAVLASAASDGSEPAWLRREVQRRLLQVWSQQPGRLETAIKELDEALAKNPSDASALERLAEVYSGLKPDAAKSVETREKLLSLRPDDRELQQQLANSYQNAREYDKAIALYRKMLDADPQRSKYLNYQIAHLLLQAGKNDEAAAFTRDTLAKLATDSNDAQMLAAVYQRMGRSAEAEAALIKAAQSEQNPDEKASLLLRVADFVCQRNDYAAAEAQMTAVGKEFKTNKAIVERVKSALQRLNKMQGKTTPIPDEF